MTGRVPGAGGRAGRGAGLFAALDLGTNNCRMLVAAPAVGGFRVVDSYSRIVRLGEGLEGSGRLSEAAMDRTIDALLACADRLARRPVRATRAVATEACRQAANGQDFLARVRERTGLRFDAISPREEALLALESCAPLMDPAARRVLLFDIGGGSTELIWVRLDAAEGPTLIGMASVPIGVVTLAERHAGAAYTDAGFEAMVEDLQAPLAAFDDMYCIGQEMRQGGVQVLGTSGTVTTLAGVALNLVRYRRMLVDGTTLTAAGADQALGVLRGLGREGLARHPCVGAERADFVLPGCAIFQAIRAAWTIPEVVVADRGLREGMLMQMMRGRTMDERAGGGRRHPGHGWAVPA